MRTLWVALGVFGLAALAFAATSAQAQDVTVTPYGFVLFNAGYNDHLATDIPVRASLADTGDSRASMLLTARQTRFGLKMKSEVEGWILGGVVELDFWGQKGSFNNGASMQSAPRLRLANFSMKKDKAQLLFGQDWTVFAPLSPNSLVHVSIPSFSSSGNLWNRLPQARLDYTAAVDTLSKVIIQIAAVRPIAADATSDSQAEVLGAGEYNGLPFAQARLAYSRGKSVTVGGSVHFGQTDWQKAYPAGNYTDDKTTTWGAAGDVKVSAGQVTVTGEGYVGSNLGMMFSNAGTRTIATETAALKVEGIDVMGGWGELTFKPANSKVAVNGGAGIEILDKDQVEEMATPAGTLSQNLTVFGNVQFDPIPKVTFAVEVGYIQSTYKHLVDTAIKESDGTNLNGAFSARFTF
jgi:hypothetical protein